MTARHEEPAYSTSGLSCPRAGVVILAATATLRNAPVSLRVGKMLAGRAGAPVTAAAAPKATGRVAQLLLPPSGITQCAHIDRVWGFAFLKIPSH